MNSQLWTKENLAWVAGIVEGEGHIVWTKPQPVREDGRWPGGQSLTVGVGMTDKDVIDRLYEIIGGGTIYGPYQPKPITRKPIYQYRVVSAEAYAILVAIFPWLHSRRKGQAITAICSWTNSHPKRKLDAAQVNAIRQEVANGPRGTASRLAKEYGVSTQTITNAVRGTKVYKWVK